jgi:cytochrome c biogenesis protein CcmG, thiol:disulfide interchange protein DsbE
LPSTIEQVHQEFKDQGLVVLPISIEEGRRKVGGWADRQKLTVPLLLDPEGDVSAAYKISATPTVFLIGRHGRLVAKVVGTKAWASEQGRALMRLLLAK